MRIVVRLPDENIDFFMMLAFLHHLKQQYPKAIIDLIGLKKLSPLVALLPFEHNFHIFNPEKYPKTIDVHRFCYNLHDVFNVDIFFATDESFASSFMGFCFRAKQRIGFKGKWNTWLLSVKVIKEEASHRAQQYLNLLSAISEKHFEPACVHSKRLVPYFDDWRENNYLFCSLKNISKEELHPWFEYFRLSEHPKIVLNGDKELEAIISDFKNELSLEQKMFFVNEDHQAYLSLIQYAYCVITDSVEEGLLASYLRAPLIWLQKSNTLQNIFPIVDKNLIKVIEPDWGNRSSGWDWLLAAVKDLHRPQLKLI
ncbi:MAG: glycosyltransferase family 9 protein [Bacteriovoracia bacterium]